MQGFHFLHGGPVPPLSAIASPLSPVSPILPAPQELSAWDQCNGRQYIQVALTFPFDDRNKRSRYAAEVHIKDSLKRLKRQRRDFSASLRVDPSTFRVYLEHHRDDAIPFKVVDFGDNFPYTFEQLKTQGFPPRAFSHNNFFLDGYVTPYSLTPVCQVRLSFIKGGLIIWTVLHHTFADGDGLRMLLECFAAQTRGETVDHPESLIEPVPPPRVDEHLESRTWSDWSDLIRDCPEIVRLPELNGPMRPPPNVVLDQIEQAEAPNSKSGHLFVFRNDRLDILRNLIEAISPKGTKRPSAYTAMCALTWAHATRARIATEPAAARCDPSAPAQLMCPVNWRSRAFRAESKDYFGNASVYPLTRVPVEDVVGACYDFNAIVPLIKRIETTIKSVDEEFVATRAAVLQQMDDPRVCGVNHDLRSPKHLMFNTWRFFGADTEWNIPGVTSRKPEAIRPVRGGDLPLGYCLIMPARLESKVQELLLYLPTKAMGLLMKDHDYMRWVDHVVE